MKVLQLSPTSSIFCNNMEISRRFLQIPSGSFFLLGPRGTGKSTWLRRHLPDALHLNLLESERYRELLARPERLRELVRGHPNVADVVIDEVQRIPELLHVVHDLIEQPRAPRFALTGSSARKLRRGGVDLLAGRAVMRSMHPFMAGEWPSFVLDRALQNGLVPLIAAAAEPEDVLRSYATLYLQQEVQAEGMVREAGAFARFLETITFSHGAMLNVANIAREIGAGRKQVTNYVEILEDLLVAFRLPVFTRRAQRDLVAHPKFYFFDVGVFQSLRPRGRPS